MPSTSAPACPRSTAAADDSVCAVAIQSVEFGLVAAGIWLTEQNKNIFNL